MAAKKKKEMDEEVERLKKEYEEKQRKKKEKEAGKEKEKDKNKDKDQEKDEKDSKGKDEEKEDSTSNAKVQHPISQQVISTDRIQRKSLRTRASRMSRKSLVFLLCRGSACISILGIGHADTCQSFSSGTY